MSRPAHAKTVLPSQRVGLAEVVAVVGGCIGLTVWQYWQPVRTVASRYIADGGDGASFVWNYWAFLRALLAFDDPFRTDLLFHPAGADLTFHTTTPLPSVVVGLLAIVLPDALSANLVVLAAVVASGALTYAVARHEGATRALAAFAAVAFMLLPQRYGRVFAHHNLAHTWVLPLGLLLLLRVYDEPSRRRGVAFGAVVAVALLTDFTYFLFLLIASALVVVWRWRSTFTRATMQSLGSASVSGVVLGAPMLFTIGRAIRNNELDEFVGWGGADAGSLDLVAWVVPPPWHIVASSFTSINERILGPERLGYVGIGVLVAGLVGGALALWVRRGEWILIASVFGVLSFGPFLHVMGRTGARFDGLGQRFSWPMPYAALHYIPVLNGLRVPARFSIVAALALGVGAAVGLSRLSPRWPRTTAATGVLLACITLVDLAPDRAYAPTLGEIPAAYEAIAESSRDGAVLEVPLQWRDGFNTYGGAGADQTVFEYYATRHGRPIVNGMVARYPERRWSRMLGEEVFRSTLALQGDIPPSLQPTLGTPAPEPFTVDDLRALDISWVVYHRDRPAPQVLAHIQSLDLPTLADDGTVVVWEVR